MQLVNKFLIVERSGACRVVSLPPSRVDPSSFVFPLTIHIPERPVSPPITLTLPALTEAEVLIGDLDTIVGGS